jgi:hypothetical protein
VTRLRAGEWLSALGAGGLFVLLFFNWFAFDVAGAHRLDSGPRDFGGAPALSVLNTYSTGGSWAGWSTLGWFMVVLLCVQMLGGVALAYMMVRRASPAWPIGAGVLAWTLGSAIWLVLLVRVCVAQPWTDALVAVRWPAYLGLASSALIPLGGLLSIKDERTRTAESLAYMPPPARTAPGP